MSTGNNLRRSSTVTKNEIINRTRQKEKKIGRARKTAGIIFVAVVCFLFVGLLNLNFFRLTKIEIVGQTSENISQVKQFIAEELAGDYLYLVPKNSVFFFSKVILAKKIQAKFPKFSLAELSLPDLNTLSLEVKDKASKLLWCNQLAQVEKCFYLDRNGIIYSEAPNFSDSIILKLSGPLPVSPIGKKVIEAKTVDQIINITNFINSILPKLNPNSLAWSVRRVDIMSFGDLVAVVADNSDGKNGKSWKILFNKDLSPDKFIDNLNSVINNDSFRRDWKSSGQNIEYLDLRFDKKVFYRFGA